MSSLSARAVACKHWRWMPGMLTATTARGGLPVLDVGTPFRVDDGHPGLSDEVAEGRVGCWCKEDCGDFQPESVCPKRSRPPPIPNLNDPATKGCLLELVREAWALPGISPVQSETGWGLYISRELVRALFRVRPEAFDSTLVGWIFGDSEAEVLVKALEAAP